LRSSCSFNTISYNVLHYNIEQCFHDEGTSNVVNNNDCLENSPPIPGYEPWLLSIVAIAAIAAIIATRKARRA